MSENNKLTNDEIERLANEKFAYPIGEEQPKQPTNGGVWVACSEGLPQKRHVNEFQQVMVRDRSGSDGYIYYKHIGSHHTHWLDTTIPLMTVAEHEAEVSALKKQRDIAINHIASWCASLRSDEAAMVDWSEHFQETLPEIHDLLMTAIQKAIKEPRLNGD